MGHDLASRLLVGRGGPGSRRDRSDKRLHRGERPALPVVRRRPGSLVGRSWTEFAPRRAAEEAEALRQSLQRHGHADSTFRLTRPDGSIFDIDYHTIVYATGDQVLYGTVIRERPGQAVAKPETFASMVETSLAAVSTN